MKGLTPWEYFRHWMWLFDLEIWLWKKAEPGGLMATPPRGDAPRQPVLHWLRLRVSRLTTRLERRGRMF